MARWPKLKALRLVRRRKKDGETRKERVKKSKATEGLDWWAALRALAPRIGSACLLVAAFLAILWVFFYSNGPGPVKAPPPRPEYRATDVVREDIFAGFDFDVLKTDEELQAELDAAEASVLPVYAFDADVADGERKALGDFLGRVSSVRAGPESRAQRVAMLGELGWNLSISTREVLIDSVRAAEMEELVREIIRDAYDKGIIEVPAGEGLPEEQTVSRIDGGKESIARVGTFLQGDGVQAFVDRRAGWLADPILREGAREIATLYLRPNVFLDAATTGERRARARADVSEYSDRRVKEGQRILVAGDLVEDHDLIVLRSMDAQDERVEEPKPWHEELLPKIGLVLQALLLLGALIFYASARWRPLLEGRRDQILFLVVLLIVMGVAALAWRALDQAEYLVPIAVLAMLMSMLFSFEIAVVTTFFTALLVALYTGFDLSFLLLSVFPGVVAAHSVRRVRLREGFYWSGIRVVGAYVLAILVIDIARSNVDVDTLTRFGLGGLNAIVSMGIVVVALPLFERGFGVTTDMTLLELADMNKPLLKKMAMKAPGSYHHSIIVGNLAEAAAEAIGANGLLARVGSYYHDIGKLMAPGYFVENQSGTEAADSLHASLTPLKSRIFIRAHVLDGVELARLEKLPEPLIDIIREHHGTSVMEYFYNKAQEEADDPSEVSPADYGYPGPRPRSKESAIISLADVVEARVRSIGETISQKRIKAEIDSVIEKRWSDHQLDDAELTLSDLTQIREQFLRVLGSMYHHRVKYPDQDENAEAESAAEPDQAPKGSDGDQDRRPTEEDRDR